MTANTSSTFTKISLNQTATNQLIESVQEIENSSDSVFKKSLQLATKLGANYQVAGTTQLGFWCPELLAQRILPTSVYLEVLTPIAAIDFRTKSQTIKFQVQQVRLKQRGEYLWGVVEGMQAGDRNRAGALYWVRYIDNQDNVKIIRDVMAHSLPFGIFAPAELYDMESIQRERQDLDYFRQTSIAEDSNHVRRLPPPVNILQIHTGTATVAGTIEGLTKLYGHISTKLADNLPLTANEQNFVGYDAVQLLPVEPTIEYHVKERPLGEFFAIASESIQDGQQIVEINLTKPTTQNWGYDIPGLGAAATNVTVLGSGRPHEMVDFIATMHNFSAGPIQVIYDIVYGHTDNQGLEVLNNHFLKGPNMYGQDLNHQMPVVRAILLETQRRKINTGVDGIRIDGAQDLLFFDPITSTVKHDDAYLIAMSDVVQEVGGYKRLMVTIYEDGRPWPQQGWEYTSTYRDMVETKPGSFQWGPLIFAHNTPVMYGFWDTKWQRIKQVLDRGDYWITGCGNHDTVRRGNQVDTEKVQINWNLGKTLPEVLHRGYDNPAVSLWVYGFSPGLPMDFINALAHAPWMFFRNTDALYGVKVVSEEVGFLDWQVEPEVYEREGLFPQMKALGFDTLAKLKQFGKTLQDSMEAVDYELDAVLIACQCALDQPGDSTARTPFLQGLDVGSLKKFARLFMEDCYTVCNVALHEDKVNPAQAKFNYELRQFRRSNTWLRKNMSMGNDRFDRITGKDRIIYFGIRSNPDNPNEKVMMVSHMGGETTTITLGDWLQLDMTKWQIAVASPGLNDGDRLANLRRFELKDTEALLLRYVGD
ncbi:hypothetical protein Pse7367_2046 [Thalassoporum mexicanum PCC 7367]|uniref:glucosylglycerol hydrolase n=1 Tax=Thalassoporum mexicanum TaxID=3457544 RepID=UPI00029FE55D|nr:glucosylglycerol hydrolase [Pseudanabaena sp. PCC 7367]AFY70315.1 hypothetical protein Pse7367_2046 [Pseudanabaena sp. PCC 7367]